jgi:cytochrome c556
LKIFKFIGIVLITLSFSSASFASSTPDDIKTAEDAFVYAENRDPFDAEIFKTEIEGLSSKEKVKC